MYIASRHGRDKHNTSVKNVISFEFSQYFDTSVTSLGLEPFTNSIFIHVFTRSSHDQLIDKGILIGSVSRYHLYYVTLKQQAIIRLIGLSDYQREIPPMSPGVNINQNQYRTTDTFDVVYFYSLIFFRILALENIAKILPKY